jgi:hypothetical protein
MRRPPRKLPPPLLSSHDRHRLMAMVGLLVMILFAFSATRKPENWNWFFHLSGESAPRAPQPLDGIDFRVKHGPDDLPLESFRLATHATDADSPPAAGLDLRQLPADWLSGVQDQRIGRLRNEEADIRRICERLQTVSQQQLVEAAERDASFRVVNVEPDQYRGRLLYLEAALWRLAPYPIQDAEHGDLSLWQAWVFTADSGNNPWVVLLTQKPDGVEPGDALDRPVHVAGYFFKRYGYPTEDGLHVAPMLIAKALSLAPTLAAEKRQTEDVTHYVIGALTVIALCFAVVIWRFTVSDRRFQHSPLARLATAQDSSSADEPPQLGNLTAVDPAEVFRRLQQAEQAKASAKPGAGE